MGDDDRGMTARRAAVAAAFIVGIGLLWWASGLGRAPADPEAFFNSEQIARANDYRTPRYWAFLGGTLLNLTVLAVLAFTPIGDVVLRPFRRWPWMLGVASAAITVVVVSAVVQFPISFWRGHLHERRWGFSTQSGAAWLGDWGRSLAVSALIAGLVYTLLVLLIRLLPRAWPAVAAGGVAGFVVLASFAWPLVIEPIFNDFRPLGSRERAAELRALAEEAEVPVDEVLVADQSRRTSKENAYVSGFGGTKRIVVWDTLLERESFDEVKLIVAHELGHRRERHVEKGTAIGAAAAGAGVVVIWLLLRSRGTVRLARSQGPGDLRIVPFLVLMATVLTLMSTPTANWISRQFEEEADRFALRLTQDPPIYVDAQKKLFLRNLGNLDPGPIVYRFLFTHPSPPERLSYSDEEVSSTP